MQVYAISRLDHFAVAYGSSAYGACQYNSTTTCASTSSSGNSGLVNTGIAVGLIVGIACLVLVLVILVRFWRRSPREGTKRQPNEPSITSKR